METRRYAYKPSYIEAVRVTAENFQEIATWSEGEIVDSIDRSYIHIPMQNAAVERHERAYIGDWVLKTRTGWKIYNDGSFRVNFVPAEEVTAVS